MATIAAHAHHGTFLFDRTMNADATGFEVSRLSEEKEYDRVVFKAQIGAELTGALVLGEAVGNSIQDDGDVDITVGRQL
ncbi:MAG TPA: hypothetical protein VJ553_05650, partial [Candidatus Paceibacterota bacterium]|nr:hypothetical protein [Candidatus Paceibacterota bacterium]